MSGGNRRTSAKSKNIPKEPKRFGFPCPVCGKVIFDEIHKRKKLITIDHGKLIRYLSDEQSK